MESMEKSMELSAWTIWLDFPDNYISRKLLELNI